MENFQTFVGWTSLETGHLTPQYDQNFVLYQTPNEKASGINCKIRVFDIAQSDVRDYLSQGGLCRVIVRGTMRTAPTPEQGWISSSTRYLQVAWIMQEQQPEFLGEHVVLAGGSSSNSQMQGAHGGKQTVTTVGGNVAVTPPSFTTTPNANTSSQPHPTSQQQQANHHIVNVPMGLAQILDEDISQEEPRSEDDEDDSDPDYSSIDAEEEERARLEDFEYDDDSLMVESSEVSEDEVEKLKAAANEPLDLTYTKKRDADEYLENGNDKKQKKRASNNNNDTVTLTIM